MSRRVLAALTVDDQMSDTDVAIWIDFMLASSTKPESDTTVWSDLNDLIEDIDTERERIGPIEEIFGD